MLSKLLLVSLALLVAGKAKEDPAECEGALHAGMHAASVAHTHTQHTHARTHTPAHYMRGELT